MQTFLPCEDFRESALLLDSRRLGKQRVEAYHILNSLERGDGWRHHPAVKMWAGYEEWLKLYFNAVAEEWIFRGFVHNLGFYKVESAGAKPPWLGNPQFHASHRAALLAKDPHYYSRYDWAEKPIIAYVWPSRGELV